MSSFGIVRYPKRGILDTAEDLDTGEYQLVLPPFQLECMYSRVLSRTIRIVTLVECTDIIVAEYEDMFTCLLLSWSNFCTLSVTS
jgi:hypothetical protein